ncbi:uncharacterized protein N7482_004519 [Penicillium canariense]|uniref:Gfo/Idh/MocA-like oxidoreductase N-terminal domain-containing protein n=1 Tax=Penicillium canariense TaxID=189055 RepID=A0A9W9LQE1_9EURO|nr:uncharacterized protein N7482_004519 [Penicillium canariense]KAJ5168925.1 hypothetical protein N7482_004519 [Penicillium canariense]
MSTPVIRIGILGATHAAESIYLPILASLHTHYHLTILHTTSDDVATDSQKQFGLANTTTVADEIINHPDVDLVINLLPFDQHEQYTLAALEAGKHVMVEVPLSLSIHGLRRIRDARKKGMAARSHRPHNTGPKVFVGCARRYAPCFTDIFKKELASLGRVYYARCRNIAGPLTRPAVQKNNDSGIGYTRGANVGNGTNGSIARPQRHALLAEIFGSDEDLTCDREAFCRFLGTLGCHDFSLMRESLGFPGAVSNVSIIEPFYSAMFHYTDDFGTRDGHPFTLVYEAGIDAVPRCDAHLTVYGAKKTLSVEYDLSCLSEAEKDVAVRVVVEEANVETGDVDVEMLSSGSETINGSANGDGNGDSAANRNGPLRPRVKRTEFVSTARETFEQEFLAMHAYLVGDRGDSQVEAKTTAEDALDDLKLMHMIFEHYDRQCGTIRTPLG